MASNLDVVFPPDLVIPKYLVTQINALEHVNITFATQGFLSLIFNDKALDEYNKIFKFLNKIQRVIYILAKKDLWKHTNENLKYKKRRREEETEEEIEYFDMIEENSKLFNKCQHKFLIFQRELFLFAKNLETFIKTRVLLHCTNEFERNLVNIKNIDTLIKFHTGFLNKVTDLCLLKQSSENLRDTILNVLNNGILLRECNKQLSALDIHAENMRIETLKIMKEFEGLRENHKICMRFIIGFMEKKTQNNITSHLDDAYCRLNFNYFYSDVTNLR
mmetsp:Transcript_31923/g.28281  ORF Transcript_31923/g.28281 Transcript_31923/m.28281 type:complete len:276 (+) Transcript_31923:192-1019(+)